VRLLQNRDAPKSIPLYSESGIFSFRTPQDSSEGIHQKAQARIKEQKIKI